MSPLEEPGKPSPQIAKLASSVAVWDLASKFLCMVFMHCCPTASDKADGGLNDLIAAQKEHMEVLAGDLKHLARSRSSFTNTTDINGVQELLHVLANSLDPGSDRGSLTGLRQALGWAHIHAATDHDCRLERQFDAMAQVLISWPDWDEQFAALAEATALLLARLMQSDIDKLNKGQALASEELDFELSKLDMSGSLAPR